ncbi:MAG: hypothetical protein LBG66_06555, partial [Gallionellaceae bacterium]|nr:hypothetical protein [Gallionellaceae bacterium]
MKGDAHHQDAIRGRLLTALVALLLMSGIAKQASGGMPQASSDNQVKSGTISISEKQRLISAIKKEAPPIVQSCIVRNVENLPDGELMKVLMRKAGADVSDASRADAVIKYVENACFEDSDFDPQFIQGRWSALDALAASIAAGEFVKTYDQQKIQLVIDDYNVHQHCIFDWIIRCAPAAEDNSRMVPEKGRYISSESEYLPPGDQSPHLEREYFSVISPQKQSSQDYVSPEGIIGRRLPDWSPDRAGFTQLRLFELG